MCGFANLDGEPKKFDFFAALLVCIWSCFVNLRDGLKAFVIGIAMFCGRTLIGI